MASAMLNDERIVFVCHNRRLAKMHYRMKLQSTNNAQKYNKFGSFGVWNDERPNERERERALRPTTEEKKNIKLVVCICGNHDNRTMPSARVYNSATAVTWSRVVHGPLLNNNTNLHIYVYFCACFPESEWGREREENTLANARKFTLFRVWNVSLVYRASLCPGVSRVISFVFTCVHGIA